jgi:predicted lipoprotein with Yx(FWY)xxD motif
MQLRHLLCSGIAAGVIGLAGVAGASAATYNSKAAPTISVRSTAYGKILVNSKGDTLYLWAKDKNDKSACSGGCLDVWPFVLISGTPTAGPGVNAKLLGTIKVKGGHEVTYNKHPLYTYVSDVKPGIISGEGNKSFGAPWWVVSTAGDAITKKP